MRKIIYALIGMLAFSINSVAAQDISGSKDHPVITRYPGSVIGYYEEQKFAPYNIATGPQVGYKKIDKWIKAEGKLTRIYYVVKGTATLTEIFGNYQTAFNKNGFKILAGDIDDKKNTSQKIGGRIFLNTFYESNPFPVDKNISLLNGSATSGGSFYLTGHLKKPTGEIYITIGGGQYKADEKVLMVDVLEKTVMENDLININAKEMMNGIAATGKIALYGIFFDFDKSVIKPESKPALEEVAKMLRDNPSLNLYVVGHTDMQGAISYNMELSEKRALAVVGELIKVYGIQASRLNGYGMGPLAPLSTNKTEEGKKQNRRVELVER